MNKNSFTDTFFVENIDEIEVCDGKIFQLTGSSFILPTDFHRIENEVHNLSNCEKCKKSYAFTLRNLEKRFENFPLCCNYHKKLIDQVWFKKEDYIEIPKLTADKIFYAWHFILKYIDSSDWEEEIIDYLQYVIHTFGSFPKDCGEPLFLGSFHNALKDLVRDLEKNKYEKKKKIILEYLDGYYNQEKKNDTDMNILLRIYNQWYKTFPFNLSIFSNLKERFSKKLPLIEKTHYNKYLQVELGIPLTKQNLIKLLENITNQIVTEINSLKLYEQGKLNEVENYKLELSLEKRKLQLKEGYINKSKSPDTRYRNILKTWLRDELEFIKNISPTFESIKEGKNNLYLDILFACSKMQENKVFWLADEDGRTKQILDLLEIKYITKDQPKLGMSATGKKPGSIDGLIKDKNETEYFIEAFNLQNINSNYIQNHINKLEENYDSKGLKNKFLIVYCNVPNNTFNSFFDKYLCFIDKKVDFKFTKKNVEELESKYINQRIIKTTHLREKSETNLYHILLKMPT